MNMHVRCRRNLLCETNIHLLSGLDAFYDQIYGMPCGFSVIKLTRLMYMYFCLRNLVRDFAKCRSYAIVPQTLNVSYIFLYEKIIFRCEFAHVIYSYPAIDNIFIHHQITI